MKNIPNFSNINKADKKENIENNILDKENEPSFIEINGVKIEIKKEHFKYPEKIRQETGILGYDRVIIDEGQLHPLVLDKFKRPLAEPKKLTPELHVMADFIQDKINKLDLTDSCHIISSVINNTKTSSALSDLTKFVKESCPELPDFFEIGVNEKKESTEIIRHFIREKLQELTLDIYRALSNDKYPDDTFPFVSGSGFDQFVKDKFFLQKIFDLESYKKYKERAGKELFGDRSWPEETTFSVIGKEDDRMIDKCNTATLVKNHYKDIIDNKVSACAADFGLNVGERQFYFCWEPMFFEKNPNYGFEIDNYFHDYLKKSVYELRRVNKVNKITKLPTFLKVFGMLEMPEDKSYCDPKMTPNGRLDIFTRDEASKTLEAFSKLMNKYGGAYSEDDKPEEHLGIEKNKYFTIDGAMDFAMGRSKTEHSRHIPIFINNDNVQQLRWGSAKYCSFYSKKGLNFITFDHADKFPNSKEA